MMARRTALSFLCISVGYSLFCIYALGLRFRLGFPIEAYWLSFVVVSIPLLCEVVFWKSSPRLRFLYLLSFSLMIHLQFAAVDSSPFLSSEDAVADYRLTSKILSDSQWRPFELVDWGFGSEYRFYPTTDFLYATLSLLTGIPLLTVVKYLFVVKAFVVIPLVERLFRRFFSQQVAYFATAIFLASPGAILFPHKESFAVIFFFMGMYVCTKTEKTRQNLLIGLFSVLTLFMTHHFTAYIFLLLLSSLFLASPFYRRQKVVKVSGQFLLFCLVAFTAWVAFVAWAVAAAHQSFLFDVFFGVLLPGRTTFSELLPLYATYEKIMVWVGLGIAAIFSVLGFLSYVRNRNGFSFSFFTMTAFLIPLLIVASVFRFSPHRLNVLVSHRIFEFGYIAIGAFSALFIVWAFRSRKRLSSSAILICAIVVLVTGPMAGSIHPRTLSRVTEIVSFRALSLNIWLSESNVKDEYLVGDHLVFFIISIYGESKVVQYKELFAGQDFSLPEEVRSKSSYVVTHIYMTDFYGLNPTKFVHSPNFHTIHTNGLLNIYRINNRISP